MDRLQANQMLGINQQLISNNGWLNLILQEDGNLVLYRTQVGQPLWASNTSGQPVHHLLMQADGNLVAYSLQDVAMWSTDAITRTLPVARYLSRFQVHRTRTSSRLIAEGS
jgi:hypothetical protein